MNVRTGPKQITTYIATDFPDPENPHFEVFNVMDFESEEETTAMLKELYKAGLELERRCIYGNRYEEVFGDERK